MGLGDPAAGPAGATVRTAPRAGAVTRGLRALLWPWRMRAGVLLTIDPDTAPMAWLSSRLRRGAWVADVHEDYRALLTDRPWVPRPLLPVLQGAVGLLMRLIARAELVLVADEHVPPRDAHRRSVMRNEPDLSLLPPIRSHRADGSFRAVYIGDNRRSRGLHAMVEAVAATSGDARPWSLDLVGPVAPPDRAWLEARLLEPDCARITSHDRLPPDKAWALAAGADVGLCLLEDTPAFRDAMPSKVYEYQACGLPTVATSLPRVAELIRGTGAGAVVDGHAETVAELRRFASETAHREALVSAARAAGEAARARPNPYDDAAALIAELLASAATVRSRRKAARYAHPRREKGKR
ncbi:glycosyltransferase [Tessaracoccus sp. G1721]